MAEQELTEILDQVKALASKYPELNLNPVIVILNSVITKIKK